MKTYSNYVIVGFVSLAIAVVVGVCIVAIIDKRLSDITINVPKPEVTVDLSKCNNEKEELKEKFESTSKKKIKVNPDWLDKILDTEQYENIEGYKQYAVAGCPDRKKKMKLYPNIVACNQPNYLTAENYYNANFNYPYIPGQSEERWLPADYEYTSFLSPVDKSVRIITRNKSKLSTKQPFPANYWFK